MNDLSKHGFALIDLAAELFEIREVRKDQWLGLLYPVPGSVYPYGRPALYFKARISGPILSEKHTNGKDYELIACVSSIDDSGVTTWGPKETHDEAAARLHLFLKEIKQWEGRCPTREEFESIDKKVGTFSEFW